ncbi:hypothetical protein PHMEG_00040518 [Phytophthora megakarya]|uniref:PiggyBac transposable element-derived protein domain-containing protein n=1 Tax=Phytophthora megakarya TaxID=4795 RepID=A0A225UDM9_9STRA|nr:hypothetical protein PHMEG_00040518 [Phytophthora megakarya]
MGYLLFSNNKSPHAQLDLIWIIRPVVDVLQRTFSRGYKPPSVISFDEATLPSRSWFNPTRQFNKDKPHKWGTKVFVACDAEPHIARGAWELWSKCLCWIQSGIRAFPPVRSNLRQNVIFDWKITLE